MLFKFFTRFLLVLSFSSSVYANSLTDVSINSINYDSLGSFQESIQENLFNKNSIDFNANDIFKKILDKKLRQLNIDVLSGEFVSSEFLLNYEDFINNNFEFSFDVYSNSVDYLKEVNKYNANINYHLQTITTNSLAQQFSISTNFDVITSQSPDKILSSVNIGPGYILGTLATVVFVKDALDKGCTNPRLDISLSSSSMTEGGSTVTLTATIEKPLAANLVVPIATSGTATSGFDYQAISSITINAGDLTGTATITSVDDSQYESSTAETIIFTASNVEIVLAPSSYSALILSSVVVLIINSADSLNNELDKEIISVQTALLVGVLSGLIQLGFHLMKLAKLVQFLPYELVANVINLTAIFIIIKQTPVILYGSEVFVISDLEKTNLNFLTITVGLFSILPIINRRLFSFGLVRYTNSDC